MTSTQINESKPEVQAWRLWLTVQHEVLEQIASHLSTSDLAHLCLTSSELRTTIQPILYSRIAFHTVLHDPVQRIKIARRQNTFMQCVRKQPLNGRWTRDLLWHNSPLSILGMEKQMSTVAASVSLFLWSTFQSFTHLHTISLKLSQSPEHHVPPSFPLFPCLKKAHLEGVYPAGTLEAILYTSEFLTEIHFKDVAEHSIVPAHTLPRPNLRRVPHRNSFPGSPTSLQSRLYPTISQTSIGFFLDNTRYEGALPQLEKLHLSFSKSPSAKDAAALSHFLVYMADKLSLLKVMVLADSLTTSSWDGWLGKPLMTSYWPNLESLVIEGVVVPPHSDDVVMERSISLTSISVSQISLYR